MTQLGSAGFADNAKPLIRPPARPKDIERRLVVCVSNAQGTENRVVNAIMGHWAVQFGLEAAIIDRETLTISF